MIYPSTSFAVVEPSIAEAGLYLLAFLASLAFMTLVMVAIEKILARVRRSRARREEQLPDQGDDDTNTIDPAATVDYVPSANKKEIDNG